MVWPRSSFGNKDLGKIYEASLGAVCDVSKIDMAAISNATIGGFATDAKAALPENSKFIGLTQNWNPTAVKYEGVLTYSLTV